MAFSNAALFSPALFTLVTVFTKEFLSQLPGLTLATLWKYPPNLAATVKVHLKQIHKNLKSIKHTIPLNVPDPAYLLDHHTKCFPSSDSNNLTTHC
jgi:hypothetical protein